MNTKNLLLASAIGAVVAVVASAIPGVVCLLCLPYWGAAVLAAWVYKRQNGTMAMNDALVVGAATGVFAGVLGGIVSLALGPVTAAAVSSIAQRYLPTGSSVPPVAGTSFGSLLLGFVIAVVFGVIGGLIGGAVFKDKPAAPAPTGTTL